LASRRSESGGATLRVRAQDEPLADAAHALALALAAAGARTLGFDQLAGRSVHVKAGALGGSAGWRYGLRRLCGGALPREREYANLEWLRARRFLAPEPLACASVCSGVRARFQLLVTAAVPGATTLEELLRDGSEVARRAALAELAREVARFHALRWVHRDLFPRNVLVARSPDGGSLWFLDCWKSGAPRPGRGAAYDLACFLLRAPELVGAELQREFLEQYFDGRSVQGAAVRDRARFLAALGAARAGLVARLAARPAEWRGHAAPVERWPMV